MIRGAARSATVLALFAGVLWPAVGQSQELAGRFYPEKQTYLVGEPVFIDFEITNTGDQPVWIDQRMGQPCIEPDPIEVVGAKHHGFGWDTSSGCFGGVGGSCASGTKEVKPGAKFTGRIFLNARFRLDHAGTYQVHARRSVPVYLSEDWETSPTAVTKDFSTDFSITLRQGSEQELEAVYQPYVNDAKTPDEGDHWQAVGAIEEMAPPFLEDLILKLADVPNRASPRALLRLNTPRAKQKLREMAEGSTYRAQEALQVLAETRDPSFLPVLIRIADKSTDGTRDLAIQSIGLFGDDAVPFLLSTLSDPDVNARIAAVRGLGLTKSRSAVSIVIGVLLNRDPQVFDVATQSLAQLTHHSITKEPWNEPPSADEYMRWHVWWLRNGVNAPIYDTDTCVQPQPLN